MRTIGWQLFAAVPIDKFINFNAQAGQFEGGGHETTRVEPSTGMKYTKK